MRGFLRLESVARRPSDYYNYGFQFNYSGISGFEVYRGIETEMGGD